MSTHITDAVSITDHVTKALDTECFLAKGIQLPAEITTAMGRMISTPYPTMRIFGQKMERATLVGAKNRNSNINGTLRWALE